MIKSQLTLYLDCKILPNKNFKVDNISTYLNSIPTKYVDNDFQYVKHGLAINIKVAKNQSSLIHDLGANFNYASIQNNINGEKIIYYFIVGKKWISQECVELQLVMDTINSFLDDIELSDKTKILRQHKDRFKNVGSKQLITIETPNKFYKNVEYVFKNGSGLITLNFIVYGSFIIKIYSNLYEEFTTIDGVNQITYSRERIRDPITHLFVWIDTWKYFTPEEPNGVEIDNIDNITISLTNENYTIGGTDLFSFYDLVVGFAGCQKQPIVDFNSEGLTPILYKKEERTLVDVYTQEDEETSDEKRSFYLAYKNPQFQEANSPIDCYLLADDDMKVQFEGTSLSLQVDEKTRPFASELLLQPLYLNFDIPCSVLMYDGEDVEVADGATGRRMSINSSDEILVYYSFDLSGVVGYNFLFGVVAELLTNIAWQIISRNIIFGVVSKLKWENNRWNLVEYGFNTSGATIEDTKSIRIYRANKIRRTKVNHHLTDIGQKTNLDLTLSQLQNLPTETIYTSSVSDVKTALGIKSLDKSSPDLIKIIKLPYSPTPMTIDNNGNAIIDRQVWDYEYKDSDHPELGGFLKLRRKDYRFISSPEFYLTEPFEKLDYNSNVLGYKLPKNNLNEPKLYHSDYYQPKFVYDSFSFIFQLEKAITYIPQVKVNFMMTSTITSRFLFEFPNYYINNANEDYPNILSVARNNEVPIYNSEYLNYIKSGYNYDVKVKNQNAAVSAGVSALTIVGSIASFVAGVAASATGAGASVGAPLIATGIGLGVSAATATITTANNIALSEAGIQQKLHQKQLQANSVSGSDDVDLMSYYTYGNKAKYCLYEMSEQMKKALYSVFYYTGYISNVQGLPDTTSRMYFNFVSAEIVFNKVPNLSIDITNAITTKYQEGITFLHQKDGYWDFEQQYENWENSILGE